MQKPKIINIPIKMEKYFGKGTMLHPTMLEIEDLIRLIPVNRITTINHIASQLAKNHGTDVTCPMRTGNAIKKISEQYTMENLDEKVPFWRVLRKDKMMIKSKNYEQWATLVEDEGFELIYTKAGKIKVNFNSDDVFSFE